MQQLRFALRQVARRPRSNVLAIATMALALGATVGISTMVDHAVLRPLPYDDPDRLVVVWNTYPQWREREILNRFWDRIDLSFPEYEALRSRTDVFDDLAIFRSDERVLRESDRADVVLGGAATDGLMRVLRVAPAIGRWFTPGDDGPDAAPVTVVRHEFWRARLGGDPHVLGRTIVLDGEAHTVVGVLPPDFRFGRVEDARTPEVWTSLGRIADRSNDGDHSFVSIARLRGGVSWEQALDAITATLRGDRSPLVRGARLVGREEYERSAVTPVMLLFAGGVGLLLLLACATVATIQLTRVADRGHEIAVRIALGASRYDLGKQLLTENVVLGLTGGTIGVLLSYLTVGALGRLMPDGVIGAAGARIDARLLAFAAALSLLTATVFGLAPMLEAIRRNPARIVRGKRAAGVGRVLALMLSVQSALAVLLLVGAALLVRTVSALDAVDPGFASEQRLTFTLSLTDERYTPERREAWFAELTGRLEALPGVTGVTATTVLPLSGETNSNSISIESARPEPGRKPEAERRIVGAGFFSSMRIPLLRGRVFAPDDDVSRPPVMLVSRAAAEAFWGDRDPLGDRVELNNRWWRVVGIVEDVRDRALSASPQPTVYVPTAQWRPRSRAFIVRTELPPLLLAGPAREIVRSMDPGVPLRDVRSMEQVIAASQRPQRARAILLGGFALLATLLALTGLYGVTSYGARLREREFAIRSALGAQARSIVRLAMSRTMSASLGGAAAGLLVAVASTRLLRRFLYGVEPSDPATLAAVVLGLCAFSAVVAVRPALRSARLNPTEALRKE